MAQLPDTSQTAYATAAQMLTFYDYNLLGQLASDTGVPVTAAALLADPNLAAALSAAAGDIEAACLVAGRYRPEDLNALVTNGGVAATKLAKLNADLAFASMRERRGYRTEEDFPQVKRAFDLLDRLRLGERIWSMLDSEQAGVGSRQDMGASVLRQEPLATSVAKRYFGMRGRCYTPPSSNCC